MGLARFSCLFYLKLSMSQRSVQRTKWILLLTKPFFKIPRTLQISRDWSFQLSRKLLYYTGSSTPAISKRNLVSESCKTLQNALRNIFRLIFFQPDIKKPVWPLQMGVTRDCSNFATRYQTTRRPGPLGTHFPTRKGLPKNLLWLSFVRMVIVFQMRPHPLRHFYFVTQQPALCFWRRAASGSCYCAHTISICAASDP